MTTTDHGRTAYYDLRAGRRIDPEKAFAGFYRAATNVVLPKPKDVVLRQKVEQKTEYGSGILTVTGPSTD